MDKFWRIFWFVRLGIAGFWTWLAWKSYGSVRDMVLVSLIISVWTMWTSDLPDGKEP